MTSKCVFSWFYTDVQNAVIHHQKHSVFCSVLCPLAELAFELALVAVFLLYILKGLGYLVSEQRSVSFLISVLSLVVSVLLTAGLFVGYLCGNSTYTVKCLQLFNTRDSLKHNVFLKIR